MLTLEFLVLLVAGFPDMQKDLKKVMAGEMEVVVNEEKSVLVLFLCSQVTRHLLDYLVGFFQPFLIILPHYDFVCTKLDLEKYMCNPP